MSFLKPQTGTSGGRTPPSQCGDVPCTAVSFSSELLYTKTICKTGNGRRSASFSPSAKKFLLDNNKPGAKRRGTRTQRQLIALAPLARLSCATESVWGPGRCCCCCRSCPTERSPSLGLRSRPVGLFPSRLRSTDTHVRRELGRLLVAKHCGGTHRHRNEVSCDWSEKATHEEANIL